MPKPTDYEDAEPTHVEAPLPTRYDRETRQYLLTDEEPADKPGAART